LTYSLWLTERSAAFPIYNLYTVIQLLPDV